MIESNSEDASSSSDTSLSTDLCQKLKDQVTLTTQLDSQINRQLTKQLTNESKKKNEVPENIQRINEIIANGQVNFLNLAELLEYKSYYFFGDNKIQIKVGSNDESNDYKLKLQAVESEKNKLTEEMYALKKLLSNVSSDALNEMRDDNEGDSMKWRHEILKGITKTFQKENELHIAELRSFVVGNSNASEHNEEKIYLLEAKISGQVRILVIFIIL